MFARWYETLLTASMLKIGTSSHAQALWNIFLIKAVKSRASSWEIIYCKKVTSNIDLVLNCFWIRANSMIKKWWVGTAMFYVVHRKDHDHNYYHNDVIMSAMASQITKITALYSAVYSGEDQRKHQSPASLAFVRGIHRWPVKSPHKWPVTRSSCNSTTS